MIQKYPNSFYRVAVKALIRNNSGQILVVKENCDKWDLPGGGLNHGEEPADGIKRELHEEIGVSDGIYVGDVVRVKSFWLDDKQAWLLWVIYDVTLTDTIAPQPGEGVTNVMFIDPKLLATSQDERERYLASFRL